MLSDEEKKAIELLKQEPDFSLNYYKRENAIDIVLNLIEKQSKEIEELKDKIKAKIEELNKDFKEYENGQEWEIQDEIRGQIEVLQSLLEKE